MHRIPWTGLWNIARDYRWWLVMISFVGIALLYYPRLILGPGAPYSLIILGRHAFDKIIFLLPIGYASYVFGWRGGILSLATAAAIIFPRDIFVSQWPVESLFESSGVIVFGAALNVGFYMHIRGMSKLKKQEEELRYFMNAAVKAQEEERKRISQDLHDSISQTLIALLHQLDNFVHKAINLSQTDTQTLQNFEAQIRQALKEVRIFGRDLRPSILDDLGLLPALEWLCDQLYEDYGIKASLEVTGSERKISHEAELTLFRVIQEATRNIAKHSKATKAEICFEFDADKIKVSIKDNGVGFAVPQKLGSLPLSGKLGLVGMQERIRLLGGSVTLGSEPGKGTVVSVEAPI